MSLLAGKPHLCVNEEILNDSRGNGNGNIDKDKLDNLCKDGQFVNPLDPTNSNRFPCRFKAKVAGKAFLDAKIWDIEDAHHIGRAEESCPYFVSSKIAEIANIVFAPYIYLVDPVIRSRSSISLTNSIVIIDEAHNLEDTCRSAASFETTVGQLRETVEFLELIEKYGIGCKAQASGLREFIQKMSSWMERSQNSLERNGYEVDTRTWSGRESLVVFESEIELTNDTLEIYEQFYRHIVKFTEKNEPSEMVLEEESSSYRSRKVHNLITRLFSICKTVLERLFIVLRFMMKKNSSDIECYRVVIERSRNQKTHKFELTLKLWCLSAHVAFQCFAEQCHSIILTSGTLSPLAPFERELGVNFPIRVEAQHVIDTASQVYVSAVSTFDNTLMTSSYLNQSNLTYLDTIGRCILTLTRVTTGGVLVFFASYSFLDKIKERWFVTQFLNEFDDPMTYTNTYKGTKIFYEPKESEKLEGILTDYYDSIDQGKQCLFLAVCRGKVSEGIDFSDNYARTVIVIGIPFPNLSSLQVKMKRSYLDELVSKYPEMGYLTGDQWYEQQAFRAVNQAFGRCIRHVKDFGAIILCDPRYQKNQNQIQLSRWVRSNVMNSHRLEDILLPMRFFFQENYERFADHLQSLEEKIQRKKPSSLSSLALIPSSSSKKKRKKLKKIDLKYEEEEEEAKNGKSSSSQRSNRDQEVGDEDDAMAVKNHRGQQTLSQIYSRYVQSLPTVKPLEKESSPHKIPSVRSQLVHCLLQWEWQPPEDPSRPSVDLELVELNHVNTPLLLQELPSQLHYLITHMIATSQTRICEEDVTSSPKRALLISNWTWPVPSPSLPCSCTSLPRSDSRLCVCQLRVVEEWNATDRVVYRLLLCPISHSTSDPANHQTPPSSTSPSSSLPLAAPIILAAKVIAVTENGNPLLNNSFVNWQLAQEIFSDSQNHPETLFDQILTCDDLVEGDTSRSFCLGADEEDDSDMSMSISVLNESYQSSTGLRSIDLSSYHVHEVDVGVSSDGDDDFEAEEIFPRKKSDHKKKISSQRHTRNHGAK